MILQTVDDRPVTDKYGIADDDQRDTSVLKAVLPAYFRKPLLVGLVVPDLERFDLQLRIFFLKAGKNGFHLLAVFTPVTVKIEEADGAG